MRLKRWLIVVFAVYILTLSLIPLLHSITLTERRWMGFGYGSYQYQNGRYYILFNDPFDGSSKPHIHLIPSTLPSLKISLIELSDWTSYVGGYNLFDSFNQKIRAHANMLNVTYVGPKIIFRKFIEVDADRVKITLTSNETVKVSLSFWRWTMDTINGIKSNETSKPIKIWDYMKVKEVNFTFTERAVLIKGVGFFNFSYIPKLIELWPHGEGFNRISVDYTSNNMTIVVSGKFTQIMGQPPVERLNLEYILPFTGALIVLSYLAADLVVDKYYERKLKAGTPGHRN